MSYEMTVSCYSVLEAVGIIVIELMVHLLANCTSLFTRGFHKINASCRLANATT